MWHYKYMISIFTHVEKKKKKKERQSLQVTRAAIDPKDFMIECIRTKKMFSYRISLMICTSAYKFQCKS